MPYRNTHVKHRFLLCPDIYAQQVVWAHTFEDQGVELGVAETNELERFWLLPDFYQQFSWTCFELSTGFPISYANSMEVAMARAKATIHCEEVTQQLDKVKSKYGLTNVPLLERG